MVNDSATFDDVTDRFIERLAEAQAAEMFARYEYGRALHVVRYSNEVELGSRAVTRAAERLSVHPSLLRSMARVAESISPAEFGELLSRRLRNALPPTWAHVTVLARARRGARPMLTLAMIQDSLSVRELTAKARGAP
jgi:hypothetical protein